MINDDKPQQLTAEEISKYFDQSNPALRKLSSNPTTFLSIDPVRQKIGLRVPPEETTPNVSSFDRIEFDILFDGKQDPEWFELTVDATGNHHEAYLLIASIADLVVRGASFTDSIEEEIESFQELLLKKRQLSTGQQIGLFAELLLLEHAVTTECKRDTITSWTGPEQEEHDFLFPHFDVEVKCTTKENRNHQIGSLSQLEASPGRALYLLSIQLTSAGAANEGRTLNQLISDIESHLSAEMKQLMFDKLEEAGWRSEDASLYGQRWCVRTTPQTYAVDQNFPRIITSVVAQNVPSSSHIVGVQYQLDLTLMRRADAIPTILHEFCKEYTK